VHSFEEDTAAGDVYRPMTAEIPLARRPRERLEFRQDGTATLYTPGAADGLDAHLATWHGRDDMVIIRRNEPSRGSAREFRVIPRA